MLALLATLADAWQGVQRQPNRIYVEDDNPSTQVDRHLSEILTSALPQILPARVLSEESLPVSPCKEGEPLWVVDPVDGTINLITGSPDFCLSVAYIAEDGRPLLSAVVAPDLDMRWEAIRDSGARRNGEAIRPGQGGRFPVMAIGIAGEAKSFADDVAHDIQSLVAKGIVLRQSGSAAIDLCRVADGTWSGFTQRRLRYWDIAAAALIAGEAGCTMSPLPRPWDFADGTFAMDFTATRRN